MRHTAVAAVVVVVVVIVVAVSQRDARADVRRGGITGVVGDPVGDPVDGATVLVGSTNGLVAELVTDRRGRFATTLLPGHYTVVFVHGSSRTSTRADVVAGKMTIVEGEADPNTGEIIYVKDRPPPPVPPRAPRKLPRLAYSDEAIVTDFWGLAWLLLDVDATGVVTRAKFLKRPGRGLDPIALGAVFAMKFEPARDASGNKIRTRTIYGLEWPSFWWLQAGAGWSRCAGTGPLNLDATHPVYRDCTPPRLENATRERWIARPIRMP